jgi:alpha-methylacyl-CoA racemase
MLLADLGAEVVRVVRPADVETEPNPVLDRGRRSVAVDLKSAAGVDVVRRLVDTAAVLLEGFRPGVAERLGFDPVRLRQSNPALVVGHMTGFGQTGPLAGQAGHDLNYIALSGVLGSIGRPGQAPVPPLNLVGDFGGGGALLALGVVSAVLHARATGVGQDIDAAMVDGSALLLAMIHGLHAQGAWVPERGVNYLDGGLPYYDSYRCSDGRYVAVGALEPAFFAALVAGLGLTGEVTLDRQGDPSYWPHLRTLFADTFATRTRDEWATRFAGTDACVTPVLDLAEAPHAAHLVARGTYLRDVRGIVHPAPAPRFSATPLANPAPPPAPGAHTDEVLAELGFTTADIDQLRRDGSVA